MNAKDFWFAVKTASGALGIIAILLGTCVGLSALMDFVLGLH